MSSSEENMAAVRACFEQGSKGNFDAFEDLVTRDYVVHPEEARGPEGLKAVVAGYVNALNPRVRIDQQFTAGDFVATRYTITGTHDGDLMGIPPSGRDVEFTGITISRCENGRIAEEWELIDAVTLLGQVGALPAMA